MALLVAPSLVALADTDDQCNRSLSLEGQLVDGADPDQVAEVCLAAAEKGNAPIAQYMAGLIYEQGIGHPRDAGKAKTWYRRAAHKGEARAQFAMGRLAEAEGAFDWALAWYAAAARNRLGEGESAWLRLKVVAPDATWRATVHATSLSDSIGGLDDIVGSGSGIVVADRYVVTNEHVVAGCDRMSIAPGIPARIVASDADRDLAILKTEIAIGAVADLAGANEVAPGETLLTGGYPGIGDADPTFVMTEGRLSTRSVGKDADEFWLLTNTIDPGNSGGPLLDERGLVRGVVFASLPITGIVKKSAPKGGREGMAIRLDQVKAFLDEHTIAYRTAPIGPVKQAAELKGHVAAITVLVACFEK
ncbi:MAG: trypsin-like peptidase domain-containing protein [Rhodospirillaceae bacterium]|nr:trypsin-like peptidase domain-containing protein [Rhodospirillaceae bacterium]